MKMLSISLIIVGFSLSLLDSSFCGWFERELLYEQIKGLKPSSFKRKCGVHRQTFEQMVEVLYPELSRTGKRGGQCKLSVEAQILLVLEYWREYRRQFHLATS